MGGFNGPGFVELHGHVPEKLVVPFDVSAGEAMPRPRCNARSIKGRVADFVQFRECPPPDGGRAVGFQPVQGICQQFYTTPRQSPRTSTLFIFAGTYPCRNPPVAQETMPDRSVGNDYAGLLACARNARNSAFHIVGSRGMGRSPQAIVVPART
jgi:hypothetical protein